MIKELYVEKASSIHNLNFWTKFICFLLLIPISAFLAPIEILLVIVVFFIVVSAASKIGFKKIWQATKIYIILIAIGLTLLALAFYQGSLQDRVIKGLIFAVRFIILICFGVLFAMVTSPIEIPGGMMKAKIPHKYGITVMVAFRMLPLISQKVSNVIDAQRARGAELELGIRNLPRLLPLFISLMVPIIHSTLETSVKLSDTLISRGYNPKEKITIPPSKFKKSDYSLLFISLVFLVFSIWEIMPLLEFLYVFS